jgi:hypothetical protein
MSTLLTPSFRLPISLPEDSAHPAVREALQVHDNALVALNQAIGALNSTVSALSPTTAAATSTTVVQSVSSETIVQGTSQNLGTVNDQTGNVTYATQQSDYGAFIILNDASPIAVTLSVLASVPLITVPWYTVFLNLGAGTATLTPVSGKISYGTTIGAASMPLAGGAFAMVVFDGTNFEASALSTIVAQNTPAVAGVYLTGYNSTTGAFSVSTPAGLSVTIVTAKLTVGGTQGSEVFTNGLLTSQVQAT